MNVTVKTAHMSTYVRASATRGTRRSWRSEANTTPSSTVFSKALNNWPPPWALNGNGSINTA
jgi:hypothetical protein